MNDQRHERYSSILSYFYPELITALVLYTMLGLIDAKFISCLTSTTCYATLGVTNTLTLFINKIAEGLSVGAVIACGQYAGQNRPIMVGKAAIATLWATGLVGFIIASFLFVKAGFIYKLLCVPEEMALEGIPFLRLRAIGIFFMFLFLGLVGFLRGIKNTRATMYCFVIGALTFIFFDYALIFGKFGLPVLDFQGSAAAFAIQYVVMFLFAAFYIMFHKSYAVYQIKPFASADIPLVRSIFALSWPVMFDKAALQAEKIWMVRLIAPMGSYALGAYGVVKDLEMLAFVPAVAFGQVVTLLASNEFGAHHFESIKRIAKRIIFMALIMVGAMLIIFAAKPAYFVTIFDRKKLFTDFASQIFPLISIVVVFDLLQIILAGALRGSSNVQVVMWTRVLSACFLFMPLAWGVSLLPIESKVMKFVLIYGSFNIVNGLTSLFYIFWFKSGRWLKK